MEKALRKALILAGFRYEPHLDNAEWAGRYFDGTSPIAQSVQVQPIIGGLTLNDPETGMVIRHCASDCIRLINFTENERRVDLAIEGEDGVRLTLEGIGVRAQLARHIPHIGGHLSEMGAKAGFKIVAFLLVFMSVMGLFFWQFQRILPSLLPDSYVHTMGESTVQFVHTIFGETCTVPEGNRALDLMAAQIEGQTDFPYELDVEVVNSPIVNALAAPGGRIIIFRGLIDKAESPEEVAGVLGHEMGHVLNLHSLKRLAQTMGMELVLALLGGSNLGSISQQLILVSFSREAEHEADLTAIDLLDEAAISTKGAAEFFERISKKNNHENVQGDWGNMQNYMATHPPSPERAKLFRTADKKMEPVLDEQSWAALRSICKKPEKIAEEDITDDKPQLFQ